MVNEEDVIRSLRQVIDPDLKIDIVSLGMIKDLKVEDGRVKFTLELTTPACPFNKDIEANARKAVESLQGVKEVEMKVTARVWSAKPSIDLSGNFSQVGNVIAVASGKGGVGKTTIAINLAYSLALAGAKVGLFDADIYGPTVPKIVKITQPPKVVGKNKIEPARMMMGIKAMSLGLFVDENTAVIWRGPLVASTVKQLLTETTWGELDYLIVDLPPGTGDAPLTLAQTIPLTGVLIVTTPQTAASVIAAKALMMFKRLGIPIIGIVENMSYLICPDCGGQIKIFGDSTVEKMIHGFEVPLLGKIPLIPEVSIEHDKGIPVVLSNPSSPASKAFKEMSQNVAARISILAYEGRARAENL